MVYKKYIKRGGKVYGPYLYHNHREGDKIITSYVGKHKEHKENKNRIWMLLPIVILLLFAIGIILFYQDFTGYASEGDGVGSGAEIGPVRNGGGANVEPTDGEETTIGSGESVNYIDPPISIDVLAVPGLDIGALVVVRKPKQVGTTFVGKLAEWSLSLKVFQGSNIEKIKVNLPPGSRYVRVIGDVPTEVYIKTISLGENIFDITKPLPLIGGVEVVIKSPGSGTINLNFVIPGPYISNEKLNSRGKEIVINNPWDVSYFDVAIIASLDFELTDPDGLKIVPKGSDEGVDYKVFDVNGDGLFDFVKFNVDVSSKSKKSYEIITLNVIKVKARKIDAKKAIVPIVDIVELSDECKEDLACGSYSPCSIDSSVVFEKGALFLGRQTAICSSDNVLCSPIYEVVRDCKFSEKEVVVKKEKPDIFLGPPIEGEKVINIYGAETGDRVASLGVSKEGAVRIIFTQQPSEGVYLSPPSCYNSVQDIDEEGIDCGVNCKSCILEVESFISMIFNKIF